MNSSSQKKSYFASFRFWFWIFLLLAVGIGIGWLYYVSRQVNQAFELQRWRQPAHVYARPLKLAPGEHLMIGDLTWELKTLGYRKEALLDGPGSFVINGNQVLIQQRPFRFTDGEAMQQPFEVGFRDNSIDHLIRYDDNQALGNVRLEPLLIGSIFPFAHEDRLLISMRDVPEHLIETLLTVEDRNFYHHPGVDVLGIARAAIVNYRSHAKLQGGSTLTQQLVKNLFLSSEKTIHRKLVEMVIALLVEMRHSKQDILVNYLNEVYLGQSGHRAIHGIGLASKFYFSRPLKELSIDEIALLVGMIRGPSQYNPYRHPELAKKRRDLVLREIRDAGIISDEEYEAARLKPLGVKREEERANNNWNAFLDLVREQIRRDYKDEDIKTMGLNIFSTLDPYIQRQAEAGLRKKLTELEKTRGSKELQGAVVITRAASGEVLAVVGDRNPGAGFNRALKAERQTGSVIKPAVYLTALEQPDRFTLTTPISDGYYSMALDNGKVWTPKNYDGRYHGAVQLRLALAHSYNVATVSLGMEMGIDKVRDTLRDLGIEQEIPPYPSILLGAEAMTPIDVTRMYQTIANGGYRIPLRTIRSIQDRNGAVLNRYPLRVDRSIPPGPAYLIKRALQGVVQHGTAHSLRSRFPGYLGLAGKTGTTNGLHDTWFAGFSGNLVNVVWVGRDDNRSTGLTGASGAMQVWAEIMSQLELEPVNMTPPKEIRILDINPSTGLRVDNSCNIGIEMPYINGSGPKTYSACAIETPVIKTEPSKASSSALPWLDETPEQPGKPAKKPRKSAWDILEGLFN